MNFPLTETVAELVVDLRKAGFGWIADEVQETIKNGKTTINVGRQATIPYTAIEQEAIFLGVLREYFVGIDAVQTEIGQDLPKLLGDADLRAVVLDENGQEITTLTGEHGNRLESSRPVEEIQDLDKLLRSAWTDEAGEFPRRVRTATYEEEQQS